MIEGKLYRLDTKRYAIDGDARHELTCGDVVEVLIDSRWERASVEASKGEYYLTNGHPIDGAYIRIE